MALVRHKCLVSVVAICLADKPLLITPLMPHGSLIDYMARVHSIQVSKALQVKQKVQWLVCTPGNQEVAVSIPSMICACSLRTRQQISPENTAQTAQILLKNRSFLAVFFERFFKQDLSGF